MVRPGRRVGIRKHHRHVLTLAVGVVAAGLGYGLFVAMQMSYGPYGSVVRTACLSNLKVIGRASMVYAADFDDRLMPSSGWMDRLSGRYWLPKGRRPAPLTNSEVLRCPCLKRLGENGPEIFGYAMNSEASECEVKSIELPEHFPLAYESRNRVRNAADPVSTFSGPFDSEVENSGRANMLFLDGHVERILKE